MPKKPKTIYLDYASSAPLSKHVLHTITQALRIYPANPSGLHKESVNAAKALAEARKSIAIHIGAHPDEIIFTSGGTEGNNLALQGVIRASEIKHPHIIVSAIEHSSILETCKFLESQGALVTYVPVLPSGIIDLKKFKAALRKETLLVSIMYANNEIGSIQPIHDIAKLIRHHRKEYAHPFPYFHTDACQAVNYLPLEVDKLGVDLVTVNGSKIYGPKGIGFLYKRRSVSMNPLLLGGNQEMMLRAGTENVAYSLGLSAALEETVKLKNSENTRLRKLQEYFFLKLKEIIPEAEINGGQDNRLPNNINISIRGILSDYLVIALDADNIAVSSKSACKMDDPDESYVLRALGKSDSEESGSIRFSLGRATRKKNIDKSLKTLRHTLDISQKWK